MSRNEHAKKHPKGCFFACCPPCRRRHSPAGSAARSPSGAKDIGMQPMSASDAASSKIRAGQRAYHKTKSKKGPGICQTLFPGTPGWIRTSGLPLRRSPRGAFLTPCKSPKILDFTGFSGGSLLVNSRPKPANFSWFFAFLLAGY